MVSLLVSSPPQLACRRGTGADAGIAHDRPPMVRQGADASAPRQRAGSSAPPPARAGVRALTAPFAEPRAQTLGTALA